MLFAALLFAFTRGMIVSYFLAFTATGIFSTPSTVQTTNATLTFFCVPVNPVEIGGTVKLTVPTTIQINTVGLSCLDVLNQASCTVAAINQSFIITTRVRLSANQQFQFQIANALTNPDTIQPSLPFSVLTSAGEEDSVNMQLTATVGSISKIMLTPSSTQVGASTALTIQWQCEHIVPAGSTFTVSIPKWNPLASIKKSYIQGQVSCLSAAVLSQALQCQFVNDTLTISQAVNETIPSFTTLAVRVIGFKNPIDTSLVKGFQITSSIGSYAIDSGSGTLQVADYAPIQQGLLSLRFPDELEAGRVFHSDMMKLQFSLPVPLNQGCQITVQLPPQYNISTVTLVGALQVFGDYQQFTALSKNYTDNSFTIYPCRTYIDNNNLAVLYISNLTQFRYEKATESVSITIKSSAEYKIAQVRQGISFTPSRGLISVAAQATVTTVQTPTSVQLQIQPQHKIYKSDLPQMILSFPLNVQTPCQASIGSCLISNQTIIISNWLLQDYSPQQGPLNFTLGTVVNPKSTQQVSGFDFIIAAFGLYAIDDFEGPIPWQLTPGSMSQVFVNPQSYVAYSSENTYLFSFQPAHSLPLNSYVTIAIPPQVQIPDFSFSQSSCQQLLGFQQQPICQIVMRQNQTTLFIQNAFRTYEGVSTVYQISIPGLTNPMTLNPTDSFTFTTFTQDGYQIDAFTGGNIQMLQSAEISAVTVIPRSFQNSAITTYSFSVVPSVPVLDSHSIIIQLPDQIKVKNLTCNSTQFTVKFVSCSANGQSIKMKLNLVSPIQAGSLITFSISGLQNPPSTQTTDSLIIKLVDQYSQTTNQKLFNVTLTMISPSPLLQADISATLYQPGIITQYILSFVPVHSIQIGGGVLITVPPQIQVQNKNISVKVAIQNTNVTPSLSIEASARALYISNVVQQTITLGYPITIFIDGLQTPFTDQPTDSFSITTYDLIDGFYYLVDQANQGLFIRAACSYPCNTCSSNSTSTCLSCYSDSALPYKQLGTCVSECNFGRYYNLLTSQCELCDRSCSSCSGTANNCLTCFNSNYPFFYQNKCLNYCPDGFIPDIASNRCLPCIDNCSTCSKTQSTCTSCDKTSVYPFLLKNRCLSECTKDISVQINDSCVLCDSSCKTCEELPTKCTSCEQHMKFDPLRQVCTTECLPQTQIYNPELEQCDTCNNTCTTCQGDINKCSACKTSYVLNKDFSCQSTCNSVTQTAVKGICMNCDEPCYSCNGTTKTCTSCLQSPTKYYLLRKAQCVQYCPAKYNVSADGLECVYIGLICPANFVPDHTGDGCIPILKECVKGYELNQDLTACVPVPGSPVPFPFLIAAVFVSFLVLGSYLKEKFFTKLYTCLLAIIGSFEIIMYALMVILSGYAGEGAICGLSTIGFICLLVSNSVFLILYQREMVGKDEQFAKWLFFHPKTKVFVPICSLLFNFKSCKIIYSGFYGLESSQAKFSKPLEFYRIMRMCTYFSFIFAYGFIFVADLVIFARIKWGYQLLVLGIETFILQILVIVLTWLESKIPPEELLQVGTAQYTSITPGTRSKEVRVKAGADDSVDNYEEGIPEVDETLFIRSQEQQKQKEMQLRLIAFQRVVQQVRLNNTDSILQCFTKFRTNRRFSESDQPPVEYWDTDSTKLERRYSWPTHEQVQQNDKFKQQIDDMIEADAQYQIDNCYYEPKKVHSTIQAKPKKMMQKRTQTYLRDLLHLEGYDQINESEHSVIVDEAAEIDRDLANIVLQNVIDQLSGNEHASDFQDHLPADNHYLQDLQDIMGEFEIDDLGNFVIIRAQDRLIDKFGRQVNKRGYLVDGSGNVVNNQGAVIYKRFELDEDGEIPAPFDQKPVVLQGKAAVEHEVVATVSSKASVHEAEEHEQSVAPQIVLEEEIPQQKVMRKVKKVKNQLMDNHPPKRLTEHQLYSMIAIDNDKQIKLAAIADQISNRTHNLTMNKSIQTLVVNSSQYLDDRIQQRPVGELQQKRPQTSNIRLKYAYAQGAEMSKMKSSRPVVVTQALRPASSIQDYSRLELQRISEIYLNQTLQVKVPQKVMGPFRPMMHQLLDDPEELNVDTEMNGVRLRTKDVSIAMAEQVDQIQRQYLQQTAWRAATTITRPDTAMLDNWIQ